MRDKRVAVDVLRSVRNDVERGIGDEHRSGAGSTPGEGSYEPSSAHDMRASDESRPRWCGQQSFWSSEVP
jgi:hypothetical protein